MLERLAWPIWNREERRIRALLRIAIHGALITLLLTASRPAIEPIAQMLRSSGAAPPTAAVAFGRNLFCIIVATWICARALDRRRFTDLGLRPRRGYLGDVALGVVIGGLCMAAIAVAEDVLLLARYTLRIASGADLLAAAPAIGSSISVFIGVAIMEELVSRGYHLTNLAEGLADPRSHRHVTASLGAVAISSVMFGLGHAANPSASSVAIAVIALGGVFLALGYLMQGDLAIPIGVHLGWNFFQNLFGMPVSGMTDFREGALFVRVETGSDLVTGGAFGPEAGLLGVAAMTLGIALTLGWIRARTGRTKILARFGRTARSVAPPVAP